MSNLAHTLQTCRSTSRPDRVLRKRSNSCAALGHIASHGVTREEAQQHSKMRLSNWDRYTSMTRNAFRVSGFTNAGRWLCVITTDRGEKTRVITAYDASKRHIELYLASKSR